MKASCFCKKIPTHLFDAFTWDLISTEFIGLKLSLDLRVLSSCMFIKPDKKRPKSFCLYMCSQTVFQNVTRNGTRNMGKSLGMLCLCNHLSSVIYVLDKVQRTFLDSSLQHENALAPYCAYEL